MTIRRVRASVHFTWNNDYRMPGKRGRPRWKEDVDPDVAAAICANLELGMPLRPAAEAEGIPDATVRLWVERYANFAALVTRAKAQGMKKLVNQSLEGGKGSSSALWHLERRYREDYGNAREAERADVTIRIEGGLPADGPNKTVVVSPKSAVQTE